jgi:hypothetical protein
MNDRDGLAQRATLHGKLSVVCSETSAAKGHPMAEEMTVEDYLAIRKEEGLKIDPSNAECRGCVAHHCIDVFKTGTLRDMREVAGIV